MKSTGFLDFSFLEIYAIFFLLLRITISQVGLGKYLLYSYAQCYIKVVGHMIKLCIYPSDLIFSFESWY
jgi:hypothetical protein